MFFKCANQHRVTRVSQQLIAQKVRKICYAFDRTNDFANAKLSFLIWESKMHAVYVNDVRVGELSDADHQAMKRSVRRDLRVWANQIFMIVAALIAIAEKTAVNFAICGFWVLMGLAYFEPQGMATFVSEFLKNPNLLSEFVGSILSVLVILSVMYSALIFGLIPSAFRCQNAFEKAYLKKVRLHLKVATTGHVFIVHVAEDEIDRSAATTV
jgi:hypothetical protein